MMRVVLACFSMLVGDEYQVLRRQVGARGGHRGSGTSQGDPGGTAVPVSPLREQRARGAISSDWLVV